MKVIRVITYEGTAESLKTQMNHSLPEGVCPFVHAVKVTVQTIHTDVEHVKFGSNRDEVAIENS